LEGWGFLNAWFWEIAGTICRQIASRRSKGSFLIANQKYVWGEKTKEVPITKLG